MHESKVDLDRIHQYLVQSDLDAVIATNPRTAAYLINSKRFDHYTFHNNLFPHFPVFPRQGDPWLVAGKLGALWPAHSRPAWIREYYDSNSSIFEDSLSLLIDTLQTKGMARARIGLDFDSAPIIFLTSVQAALPDLEFVDASILFQQLRARKTEKEVELLRASLASLEDGSRRLLQEVSPGKIMQEMMKIYAKDMEKSGGTYVGGNWTNSCLEWFPEDRLPERSIRFSREWILAPHELVRVNTLGYLSGYWSDNGMMFSLGELDREDAEKCELQWQALRVIAREIKPWMTPKEAYSACKHAIDTEVGYEGSWDCHSIGLDVMEDPWLGVGVVRRESDILRFEPNSVICIEAGSGAEQSFVMGEESLHRISALPQKLHVIPI